jgi:hypothetical protein
MLITPTNPGALRQADIVAAILFPIPRVDQECRFAAKYHSGSGESAQIVPILGGTSSRPKYMAEVECAITYCAVLSHCCDVDPKQSPPPPSFVLCRVVPVPKAILSRPEQLGLLEQNSSPFSSAGAFHSLFYIGEIDGMRVVADFGQAMTIAWSDYKQVLKKRAFAVDDVTRAKFRVKAGFHLGRPAEEDRAAGLEDPWADENNAAPPSDSAGTSGEL